MLVGCYKLSRRKAGHYRFVEHYAGVGRMAQAAHRAFGPAIALDKAYTETHNILTPGGFACRAWGCVYFRFWHNKFDLIGYQLSDYHSVQTAIATVTKDPSCQLASY